MGDRKKILIITASLVALLVFSAVLYNGIKDKVSNDNLAVTEPSAEEQENQNEPILAPDFTVVDIDGNEVKLSDMRGKPVIVNFWASWCGPCKSEMPDFEEAYKKYGDEICFMMVNMTDGSSETVSTASKFIASKGYSFPVYYDTKTEAAIAYGVYSIPATYFIDSEGRGIAYAAGAIDSTALQKGIDMIYSAD